MPSSLHIPLVLCAVMQHEPVPANSDWNHFPVFVWPSKPGASEIVREFGGACVQREDDARALRESQLDHFVFNAPGRDDLHLDREAPAYQKRWQEWYDTRSDALLVRQPCLTDPSTLARLRGTLADTLEARDGKHGFGVSLGDEIGLTPGGIPSDVCLSSTCRDAWKSWWPSHASGDAPALAAISTNATIAKLDDASSGLLGAWLLRRAFHQDVVLDVVARLAQQVRSQSPGTPVGLLGIAGQSAFGGVAVERVLPLLDFVECYRVGDARELLFTLREPHQRTLATIFVDRRGPDFSAWQAWEFWMRGGDGLVIWSEAELAKHPDHRKRLSRAIADIRAVQAKVGRFRPEPQGIAVVHSQAAIAVEWLLDAERDGLTWPRRFQSYQEEHGVIERARRRWLEFAEDCGAMPGVVPLDQIDAETARRFRVLVLPHQIVVDDADQARLQAFVAVGGHLILDGEFGTFRSDGSKPPRDRRQALLDWREGLCDRVGGVYLPPPEWRRLGPGPELRGWVFEWWHEVGLERPPFVVGGSGGEQWTWISTWMPSGEGLLCAVLGKPRAAADSTELDLLPPAELDVGPIGERAIVWIHPQPDVDGRVRLPDGDAAVFRLLPKR